MNPWKKILLSDYENHMSLESVAQLQALNRIMKEQFCIYEMLRKKLDINEELHGNVMILGVAGGNGLEHITPKYYEKIYGVDINAEYLEAVKTRYTNLSGILECLEVDLITEYEKLPKSDYVIADLLVEYIGYKAFQRVIRQVDPEMISCVIQMNPKKAENENSEWVSDSPYLHAFDGLDEVHQQMEEDALWRCLKELGYDEVDAFNTPLPNDKYLLRIDFAKSMERYKTVLYTE